MNGINEIDFNKTIDMVESNILKYSRLLKEKEKEIESIRYQLNKWNQYKNDFMKEHQGIIGDRTVEQWKTKSQSFVWSNDAREKMLNVFGIKEYRECQEEIINATLSRKDVFAIMPTGGGKSLCYQLPAILDIGVTIVISPLVSLMFDQVEALLSVDVNAVRLDSSNSSQQNAILNRIMCPNDPIQLLYVTPEKINQSNVLLTALQRAYRNNRLARIVIDEAHCCSQWGHDFRPDYGKLKIFKQFFPNTPIIALTATATPNVVNDVKTILQITNCEFFSRSLNRPNLFFEVLEKPSKMNKCIDLMLNWLNEHNLKGKSGIIYCLSKRDTESIAGELKKHKVKAEVYHSEISASKKERVHRNWTKGSVQVVVATIAFGMGIDKPNVRYIIHHTMSKSFEGYYQESGRAGRDGQFARCLLLYRLGDVSRVMSLATSGKNQKNNELGIEHVQEMVKYCVDVKMCRREFITKHFRDTKDRKPCNSTCDNCRKISEQKDITQIASTLGKHIINVQSKGKRLTLAKLVDSWTSRENKKTFHDNNKFTRVQREHVVAYLFAQQYLDTKIVRNRRGFTTVYIESTEKLLMLNQNNPLIMQFDVNKKEKKIQHNIESTKTKLKEKSKLEHSKMSIVNANNINVKSKSNCMYGNKKNFISLIDDDDDDRIDDQVYAGNINLNTNNNNDAESELNFRDSIDDEDSDVENIDTQFINFLPNTSKKRKYGNARRRSKLLLKPTDKNDIETHAQQSNLLDPGRIRKKRRRLKRISDSSDIITTNIDNDEHVLRSRQDSMVPHSLNIKTINSNKKIGMQPDNHYTLNKHNDNDKEFDTNVNGDNDNEQMNFDEISDNYSLKTPSDLDTASQLLREVRELNAKSKEKRLNLTKYEEMQSDHNVAEKKFDDKNETDTNNLKPKTLIFDEDSSSSSLSSVKSNELLKKRLLLSQSKNNKKSLKEVLDGISQVDTNNDSNTYSYSESIINNNLYYERLNELCERIVDVYSLVGSHVLLDESHKSAIIRRMPTTIDDLQTIIGSTRARKYGQNFIMDINKFQCGQPMHDPLDTLETVVKGKPLWKQLKEMKVSSNKFSLSREHMIKIVYKNPTTRGELEHIIGDSYDDQYYQNLLNIILQGNNTNNKQTSIRSFNTPNISPWKNSSKKKSLYDRLMMLSKHLEQEKVVNLRHEAATTDECRKIEQTMPKNRTELLQILGVNKNDRIIDEFLEEIKLFNKDLPSNARPVIKSSLRDRFSLRSPKKASTSPKTLRKNVILSTFMDEQNFDDLGYESSPTY